MPEELLIVCGADDCRLALNGSDILEELCVAKPSL